MPRVSYFWMIIWRKGLISCVILFSKKPINNLEHIEQILTILLGIPSQKFNLNWNTITLLLVIPT